MDCMMKKTRFALKRYRDKIKTEKKQNQLNKKMLKKWNKKQKNDQIEK